MRASSKRRWRPFFTCGSKLAGRPPRGRLTNKHRFHTIGSYGADSGSCSRSGSGANAPSHQTTVRLYRSRCPPSRCLRSRDANRSSSDSLRLSQQGIYVRPRSEERRINAMNSCKFANPGSHQVHCGFESLVNFVSSPVGKTHNFGSTSDDTARSSVASEPCESRPSIPRSPSSSLVLVGACWAIDTSAMSEGSTHGYIQFSRTLVAPSTTACAIPRASPFSDRASFTLNHASPLDDSAAY